MDALTELHRLAARLDGDCRQQIRDNEPDPHTAAAKQAGLSLAVAEVRKQIAELEAAR